MVVGFFFFSFFTDCWFDFELRNDSFHSHKEEIILAGSKWSSPGIEPVAKLYFFQFFLFVFKSKMTDQNDPPVISSKGGQEYTPTATTAYSTAKESTWRTAIELHNTISIVKNGLPSSLLSPLSPFPSSHLPSSPSGNQG